MYFLQQIKVKFESFIVGLCLESFHPVLPNPSSAGMIASVLKARAYGVSSVGVLFVVQYAQRTSEISSA
jgi:hypothetical protein